MKKLVYYFIFLLAFVLMLLCSSACRSPRTVTYKQSSTDSAALHTILCHDTTDTNFTFSFDSVLLCMESGNPKHKVIDLPLLKNGTGNCHAVIYGGSLSSSSQVSHSSCMTGSSWSASTNLNKSTRIRSGPTTPTLFLFLLLLTCLLLFLELYKRRGFFHCNKST